ncbi:hypothetical protein B296_00029197, partial [Ensete ventricosum]
MQCDRVESSLGDSSKESGSSLGTQREIVRKKTGGLTTRVSEVAGLCESYIRQRNREIRWEHIRRLPEEDHRTRRKNAGGYQIIGINCPYTSVQVVEPPKSTGKPPIPDFFGGGDAATTGAIGRSEGQREKRAVVDFDSENELIADGVKKVPLLVGADATVVVHKEDGLVQKNT